jgi:uncharacterized protein
MILYFDQESLIFQGSAYQGSTLTTIAAPPDCQLLHLTIASRQMVVALYGAALLPDGAVDPEAAHRKTILYFYGNGGAIAFDLDEFQSFRLLDCNVLMPDYVGYGMSSGHPTEAGLYATADAAYDYLNQVHGQPPGQIVAAGWSLGAAVAIDLASRRPVAGCAMFCAFTTMREMAHLVVPHINTDALLKYQFDNLRKISTISCPLFICTGLQDRLVPPQMSDRLAAAAKAPVTLVKVPDADHNGIFSDDPDAMFPALERFLQSIR